MQTRVAGLTLLELMVTLGLATLGLALGLPAFAGLIERTHATSAFHLVSASLMSARTAAVTRGHPVTVCPSKDGRVCRTEPIWEDGWIIFADRGRLDSPADESSILRRMDTIGGRITVRGTRGRLRVRYLPDGRAHGSNVSVRICSADAEMLGKVVVSNAGRARSERGDDGTSCPARG